MTKGKAITGLSLLLIIVITGLIAWDPWSHYKVNLFKSGNGYGYEILTGHNPYIYQPYMPAVEGQVPFSNRRSARKTAKVVIKKIREHKSPAITKEELKAILDD